jgi:hypothetical protein
VERTEIVEEPEITLPEAEPVSKVKGTVNVVRMLTVVTGPGVASTPPVLPTVTVEAAVTIAGLEGTKAMQMPWK